MGSQLVSPLAASLQFRPLAAICFCEVAATGTFGASLNWQLGGPPRWVDDFYRCLEGVEKQARAK